ncbi:hypothetical protein [Natronobacterium gregoryi]|uniref:ABC-2 type transport system permease protein n=2 Tax=Natronobacterium gregoryi TaxID=44930 RepID=L0ALF0_NATGS|nr:hypothetical protein [Natronobacterium gregoryi]AFZ74718.1 hypothetical protein Natgr_3605 [Natronobacterium gregoryi SP2]ELY73475.1 hypothetical protein C490_01380 [Natronobacterium gregoryi SP2]PLK20962.1 hypothetical protein CYV19_06790 [Natronobacterium gregoryi SP2]SFJ04165.1 hypothetical protein SAMN05443661_11239 [Natronobacterium gregoryi]
MREVAATVAGTECRRTLRAIGGDRTKLLVMAAIAVLALGPMTAIGLFLLPRAGEAVAAGEFDPETVALATDIATGGAAIAWLFLVLMAAIRTVTAAAAVDEPACLLLSTRLRNVVVGVIGAEILLFSLWLVLPATILAAAFASGAGTVLPVLVAPLVVAVFLVTAVPVGFVLGLWFRHLITVYEPIARYRTPLLVSLAVAYFGSIAVGWFDTVTAGLFSVFGDSPLGWPGYLLLAGVPNVPSSGTAVVATLLVVPVVAALAVAAAVPSARIHWFADPARTDDGTVSNSGTDSSSRLAAALSQGLSRPVRSVTVAAVRRTRRAPIRLAYVAYPLFGALFFVQDVIQTGTLPSYVAVLLCLYVVWGTGVLFTLNPLGDLGRALPAVLTSTLSGRDAIRGQMIASSLVGTPIAVAVALVAGLVSPLSLEATTALAVGTVVGAVASPALAVGVGSAFPRFGSVKITTNREAVMPSKSAFMLYTAGIVFPAAGAGIIYTDAAEPIAELSSGLLEFTPISAEMAGVTPGTVSTVAWTVLIVGLLAPPAAYLYAVERFDRYALE